MYRKMVSLLRYIYFCTYLLCIFISLLKKKRFLHGASCSHKTRYKIFVHEQRQDPNTHKYLLPRQVRPQRNDHVRSRAREFQALHR